MEHIGNVGYKKGQSLCPLRQKRTVPNVIPMLINTLDMNPSAPNQAISSEAAPVIVYSTTIIACLF